MLKMNKIIKQNIFRFRALGHFLERLNTFLLLQKLTFYILTYSKRVVKEFKFVWNILIKHHCLGTKKQKQITTFKSISKVGRVLHIQVQWKLYIASWIETR